MKGSRFFRDLFVKLFWVAFGLLVGANTSERMLLWLLFFGIAVAILIGIRLGVSGRNIKDQEIFNQIKFYVECAGVAFGAAFVGAIWPKYETYYLFATMILAILNIAILFGKYCLSKE